jgi:hypothetical protein
MGSSGKNLSEDFVTLAARTSNYMYLVVVVVVVVYISIDWKTYRHKEKYVYKHIC